MIQQVVHYFLHLGFPLIIALLFYREQWFRAYVIFLLTMLVDLDHLVADPIFDSCRCSIGFHPLHSYIAIAGYFLLLIFKKTRIVAIGLIIHMTTDLIDCGFNKLHCP